MLEPGQEVWLESEPDGEPWAFVKAGEKGLTLKRGKESLFLPRDRYDELRPTQQAETFRALSGTRDWVCNRSPMVGDQVYCMEHFEFGVVKLAPENAPLLVRIGGKGGLKQASPEWTLVDGSGDPSIEELAATAGRTRSGLLKRPQIHLVNTIEAAEAMFAVLEAAPTFAMDTETTGLLNRLAVHGQRFIIGFCFSADPDVGYYVPWGHTPGDNTPIYDSNFPRYAGAPPKFLTRLKQLCRDKRVVFHNAAFDLIALSTLGIEVPHFEDTMVMAKLLDDNRMGGGGYRLKALAAELLGREGVLKYKDVADNGVLTHLAPKDVALYAASDAANTLGLYRGLATKLAAEEGLYNYYRDVELRSIREISLPAALNGLRVDGKIVEDLQARLLADQAGHEKQIDASVAGWVASKDKRTLRDVKMLRGEIVELMRSTYADYDEADLQLVEQQILQVDSLKGLTQLRRTYKTLDTYSKNVVRAQAHPFEAFEFNPNSTLQKLELVYDYWRLPVVKRNPVTAAQKAKGLKEGNPSLDKFVPPLLKGTDEYRDNPDAQTFFEAMGGYTKVGKILSGFITPTLETLAIAPDSKVRPSVNSLGAKSSRSSCSSPNLQQLVSSTVYDFRAAFIPDTDDHVFIDADFNSQEVRVMAAFSRDPELLRLIEEERDLHCHTVRAVWPELAGLSDDEIKSGHKAERQVAKITFFLTGYGGGALKLSMALNQPVELCKRIIQGLKYRAFPRLTEWNQEMQVHFRQVGFFDIRSATGFYRRRHDGWQHAEDPEKAESASVRSAVNSIIQGSSAIMMKESIFRVNAALEAAGIEWQFKIPVHDQGVWQVRKEQAQLALKIVEEHMSSSILGVPVPAEARIATSLSKSDDAEWREFVEDEDDLLEAA